MEYGGAALVQTTTTTNNNNNSAAAAAAAFGSLLEDSEVGDLIDELLVEGCWLETTGGGDGCYNLMHPSCDDTTAAHLAQQQQPQYYMPSNNNSSSDDDQIMMLQQDQESFVVGKRWWIGPRGSHGGGGPSSSVKERLVVAVGYLREYYIKNTNTNNNNNVLFQVWVPPCRSGLGGSGLHHYHNDRSSINEHHIHEAVGFPTPTPNANINPNIRLLRSHDYPRLLHQYDARGSLALPVFERGTGACLGVLDILIPNHQLHMFNYRPQLLDNVCNALEAVDFRSCQNFIIQPHVVKVLEELYQAALSEIVEVITSVCKTHNFPLALTWAPCIQQGKCCGGCISTVDSACFVGDLDMLGFQEACMECHMLRGQGIVGTAITTTKPCFAMDITAFSKAEYPLAHHANVFGMHAAVAIPLRSVYTGSAADFVLEFFLPKECHDSEQQKHLLNSLSMLVQQACRSLHVPTSTADLLLDDHYITLPPPTTHDHDRNHKLQQLFAAQIEAEEEEAVVEKESSSTTSTTTTTSWIAHMMEAQGQQNKGKGVCVSMEYHQLEEPKEEFKVTTNWDTSTNQGHLHFSSSDFGHIDHTSASASGSRASAEGGFDQQDSYAAAAFGGRRSSLASSGGRKSGDKRRTKAEKTISLPVLRQYFAGSLKDAAKSIGVCPTTLKRICRQHGITRWPSRKIKKVGHSLKKLQLVIDSVQGAEGAIQIGSFYASFPELSSVDLSSSSSPATTISRSHQSSKNTAPNTLKSSTAVASASCSSQTTATFGAGNHNYHHQLANNSTAVMMMTESCDAAAELQHQQQQYASSSMLIQEEMEEEDTKHFTWRSHHGAFRVKATFVDEKIRFSLQPNWGFRELQVEIARRFSLNDISNMDLRYLDDDREWVLLACDADLQECKDIHTTSQTRTIRLSLFHPNTSFAATTSPPPILTNTRENGV